jgi:hypothetical protein
VKILNQGNQGMLPPLAQRNQFLGARLR